MEFKEIIDLMFTIIAIPIYIWMLVGIYRIIKNTLFRRRQRRQRRQRTAQSRSNFAPARPRTVVSNTTVRASVPATQFSAPNTVLSQNMESPQSSVDVPQRNRMGYEGKETGEMIYYARETHGLTDKEYRFNFKLVNNEWRAYITKMPSYGSRETWGHVTHRHFDGEQPYICWDKKITDLKDMQTVAKAWSDMTQKYIATGQRFG